MTPITVLSGTIGFVAAVRILEWLARDAHTNVSFDVPAPGYGERAEVVIDRPAANLGVWPWFDGVCFAPFAPTDPARRLRAVA